MWYEERINKQTHTTNPTFSMCCIEGRVKLETFKQTPPFLDALLDYKGGKRSSKFRDNIRAYNSIFAFTSMGAHVDNEINRRPGPYVFRISGQIYHRIGSLLPCSSTHKFLQLYMYDDLDKEVCTRMNSLSSGKNEVNHEESVVRGILEMLDKCNRVAQAFRMARDRLKENPTLTPKLRLISSTLGQQKQYNAPSTSEVAALIVGDFGQNDGGRDIIVEHKTEGLQRISERHRLFMALQYPVLFPNGEDGYFDGIAYDPNSKRTKIKRKYVTMKEFYACRLQQRTNQGTTLLRGGRLLQQFIVDCYTCIEEERLRYIRYNQDHFRTEILRNVCDAVKRGDNVGEAIGKRIVLPSSFTGGPRYMEQNRHGTVRAEGICTKKFPKPFYSETTIDENGFAIYRRDNSSNVKKGDVLLDNRFVVPYNKDLLLMFEAHINVEWCHGARAMKYLFKYLSKGPDRTTVVIKYNNVGDASGSLPEDDEIKHYLDCRYLSACEASWRIFEFDIHHRNPSVYRFQVHLEGEQSLTLRDNQRLTDALKKEQTKDTMLTQWDEDE